MEESRLMQKRGLTKESGLIEEFEVMEERGLTD